MLNWYTNKFPQKVLAVCLDENMYKKVLFWTTLKDPENDRFPDEYRPLIKQIVLACIKNRNEPGAIFSGLDVYEEEVLRFNRLNKYKKIFDVKLNLFDYIVVDEYKIIETYSDEIFTKVYNKQL